MLNNNPGRLPMMGNPNISNWNEIDVEVAAVIEIVSGAVKLIIPSPGDLRVSDRWRYDSDIEDDAYYTLDTAPDFDPEVQLYRDVANAIQRELDRRVRSKQSCVTTNHRLTVKVVKGNRPNTLGLIVKAKRAGR